MDEAEPRMWDECKKVRVRGPPPRRLAGNMVLRDRLGAKKGPLSPLSHRMQRDDRLGDGSHLRTQYLES